MSPSANPRYRRQRERVYRKGFCCWCQGPLPPPPSRRTSWCSDACVAEYLAQDPKALREKVKERDRGVCAACGRDAEALAARIKAVLAPFWEYSAPWPAKKRALRLSRWLDRLKLTRSTCSLRHLWEADHVVPVVEGGPNTLGNLRTLCTPCHKAETRTLARRRAKARREAKQPVLFTDTRGR